VKIDSKILQTLIYFDVFEHTLNLDDLYRITGVDKLKISEELDQLTASDIINKSKLEYGFGDVSSKALKKKMGSDNAKNYMPKATSNAKLIAKFPYVRGVFISGSLSKDYMPEDGDVDYFIITEPNRLWIARTLLIFYKKVFLLNSRKYFCVNYFIDSNTLEIEQQNIFTATELVTLMPIINSELYEQLLSNNKWTSDFYNQKPNAALKTFPLQKLWFKKAIEKILNTKIGEQLDQFFMNITLKRWKKKFGELPDAEFDISFKTTKKISKHHPSNFQKKVLDLYQTKLEMVQTNMQKQS